MFHRTQLQEMAIVLFFHYMFRPTAGHHHVTVNKTQHRIFLEVLLFHNFYQSGLITQHGMTTPQVKSRN